jgi:hypothetical protein
VAFSIDEDAVGAIRVGLVPPGCAPHLRRPVAAFALLLFRYIGVTGR